MSCCENASILLHFISKKPKKAQGAASADFSWAWSNLCRLRFPWPYDEVFGLTGKTLILAIRDNAVLLAGGHHILQFFQHTKRGVGTAHKLFNKM